MYGLWTSQGIPNKLIRIIKIRYSNTLYKVRWQKQLYPHIKVKVVWCPLSQFFNLTLEKVIRVIEKDQFMELNEILYVDKFTTIGKIPPFINIVEKLIAFSQNMDFYNQRSKTKIYVNSTPNVHLKRLIVEV